MKIAIVGGGIFGVTIAWTLAKRGFEIHLFEQQNDILQATSGINQYRLHRGYHYPRSEETALSCRDEERNFVECYGESVISNNVHYYAVAKEKSLSSVQECKDIWDRCGLEYTPEENTVLDASKVSMCVRVRESIFDVQKLRDICWKRLREYGVHLHLSTKADEKKLVGFDFAIVATYAHNNEFLSNYPLAKKQYQFELCEKPVLELPVAFKGKSTVVIDGPFMCIDPLGNTGRFLMGNVVHAIHHTNIGETPEIPPQFRELLNKGIISDPPVTNIAKFIESAAEFFPLIKQAKHVGSMYTIRTVLPFREHDDARPTVIERVASDRILVFAGKIPTCVGVADDILRILEQTPPNDP